MLNEMQKLGKFGKRKGAEAAAKGQGAAAKGKGFSSKRLGQWAKDRAGEAKVPAAARRPRLV